jgi:hypothetical protein
MPARAAGGHQADTLAAVNGDYCCDTMRADLERVCDQHPDRWDCPDALIGYFASTGEYGLIVHDGGSSMSVIEYCPWCGAKLTRSRDARSGRVIPPVL